VNRANTQKVKENVPNTVLHGMQKVIFMLEKSHLNVRPVVKAICIEVISFLITAYI